MTRHDRAPRLLPLVATALCLAAAAGGEAPPAAVVVDGDLDQRIRVVDGWRYHPGDDPAWADPALDDSGWAVVDSTLPVDTEPPGGWPGIGWFRHRLELGAGRPATALALRPVQWGASEVYLDGRLLHRFGSVAAEPAAERPMFANDFIGIVLEPGRQHLLAVRYSNARNNVNMEGNRGFAVFMRSVVSAASSYHRFGFLVMAAPAAFVGVFAALALLHLMLFAFYPASREHLVFGLFSALVSLLYGLAISYQLTTDLIVRLHLFRVYMVCDVLSTVLALLLIRVLVGRRPGWPTWALAAVGTALVAWVATWPAFKEPSLLQAYFLVAYVEMLRVAVAAAWRRQTDVWIVAVAFVPMTAVGIVSLSGALLGRPLEVGLLADIALAVLAVAFALYISLRSARTGRELERRLAEVRQLTDRAVEQERRAAREEAERKILEAENDRRTRELEEARRLQLAMLPHGTPAIEGFDLAFAMVTATEVGGDYVDVKAGDGAPPLLAVGDATSHGLQAGMVVAVAKSLFQGVDPADGPLAVLDRVGGGLQAMHERHASMAMVVIQVATDRLRVASAGMPPVLIHRRATGEVEEVLIPGVPLGTLSDARYRIEEVPVGRGDTILVASDGLVEAVGADGEPFGYVRAAAELQRFADRPAREVVDGMLAAVRSHLADRPSLDDVTVVALVAQ
ncbi:MAG TPA: SpoIIE family protein phosphatase [Candidatus Sulfomarinibacteraceae bacterium]|nr:SpoIIE family protein phosphatase [Candidatus Sulfomarinibacteraceae bacterium]